MGVVIQRFKRCTNCGGVKLSEQDFHRHREGFRKVCKACVAERNREYRQTHPENRRASQRAWRESHREQVNQYQRLYRLRKKERDGNCN